MSGQAQIGVGPFDDDPVDVYRCRIGTYVRWLLDAAVEDLDLGAYDRRIIEWLKQTDQPTVANLIASARSQGAAEGRAAAVAEIAAELTGGQYCDPDDDADHAAILRDYGMHLAATGLERSR